MPSFFFIGGKVPPGISFAVAGATTAGVLAVAVPIAIAIAIAIVIAGLAIGWALRSRR